MNSEDDADQIEKTHDPEILEVTTMMTADIPSDMCHWYRRLQILHRLLCERKTQVSRSEAISYLQIYNVMEFKYIDLDNTPIL